MVNIFKLASEFEEKTKGWKLYLDDQIFDKETPNRWVLEGYIGASSSDEAKKLVEEKGLPIMIDFDHDLGGDDKATNFLNWLKYWALDRGLTEIPQYKIHSANPVGKNNLISLMESWRKVI